MVLPEVTDQAFVTLATNDPYGLGALTLGHSLKRVGTTRVLVCMITSNVTSTLREELAKLFVLVEVNVLDSHDSANLALLTRPDLGVTFTKLHCWRLTNYNKCVFLDADTLVLQNIDDLFERDELSAAADVGWPDCFNSGVFVFKPSEETYAALMQLALTSGSFDGGDQGLLNSYFSDWATKDINRHLPFLYNVIAQKFYTYLPAYKRFGKDAKVIHFIGPNKPWHASYNPESGHVDCPGDLGMFCQEFLKLWWEIFSQNVHMSREQYQRFGLDCHSHGSSGIHHESFPREQLDDQKRQQSWERGMIDYMGIDSFHFIQQQLDARAGKPTNGSQAEPGSKAVPPFPMPVQASKTMPSALPFELPKPLQVQPERFEPQFAKPVELPKPEVPSQQVRLEAQSTKPLEMPKPIVHSQPVEVPQKAGTVLTIGGAAGGAAMTSPPLGSPTTPPRGINITKGISIKSSSSVHHGPPTTQASGHHPAMSSVKIITKGRNK